jgi:hypothetical protein
MPFQNDTIHSKREGHFDGTTGHVAKNWAFGNKRVALPENGQNAVAVIDNRCRKRISLARETNSLAFRENPFALRRNPTQTEECSSTLKVFPKGSGKIPIDLRKNPSGRRNFPDGKIYNTLQFGMQIHLHGPRRLQAGRSR